ncbi:M23 family metallopeptidase [Sphingomicrobium sp. XHP0235]|uniref:M23 family metallopeptidase n=1 Tax=Sphingomicrobium aquimarinum TaxID=3133971 RepID=UPI0031FEE604
MTRLKVSVFSQIFAVAMFFGLTGWAGFATAQLMNEREASLSLEAEIAWHKQIEERQVVLATLANRLLDERYAEQVKELEALGVADRVETGQGGPFEAADSGDKTFAKLFKNWKRLDNLADGAIAVPSAKPVEAARLTSSYGTRNDPFKNRRARHAGIDLAGPIGTPILATADGVVKRAGRNSGGYGNLVEVDHGNGIITRYAHMSKIDVRAGDRVSRGQPVGKMGSTGRSTGSHLHYEVRIDGRSVNPIPFMESTDYLVALRDADASDAMHGLGGSE